MTRRRVTAEEKLQTQHGALTSEIQSREVPVSMKPQAILTLCTTATLVFDHSRSWNFNLEKRVRKCLEVERYDSGRNYAMVARSKR
jgi:hypothetical protein